MLLQKGGFIILFKFRMKKKSWYAVYIRQRMTQLAMGRWRKIRSAALTSRGSIGFDHGVHQPPWLQSVGTLNSISYQVFPQCMCPVFHKMPSHFWSKLARISAMPSKCSLCNLTVFPGIALYRSMATNLKRRPANCQQLWQQGFSLEAIYPPHHTANCSIWLKWFHSLQTRVRQQDETHQLLHSICSRIWHDPRQHSQSS